MAKQPHTGVDADANTTSTMQCSAVVVQEADVPSKQQTVFDTNPCHSKLCSRLVPNRKSASATSHMRRGQPSPIGCVCGNTAQPQSIQTPMYMCRAPPILEATTQRLKVCPTRTQCSTCWLKRHTLSYVCLPPWVKVSSLTWVLSTHHVAVVQAGAQSKTTCTQTCEPQRCREMHAPTDTCSHLQRQLLL